MNIRGRRTLSAPGTTHPTGASWPRGSAAGGGAWAGFYGGIIAAVYMLSLFFVNGRSIWLAAKLPAAPFLSSASMTGAFELGPVVAGAAIHFAVAMFWGVAFGLVFYGFSRPATMFWGAVWGAFVWFVMYHLWLPLVPADDVRNIISARTAFVPHLLFGLGVALGFLPFQRHRFWSRSRQHAAP